MLDTVLRAFVRELLDSDVRRDILRELISADRSLIKLHTIAEESQRAKIEYERLQSEIVKIQELKFYKELIQRNMSNHQIEVLKTTYNANLMPQWEYEYPNQPPLPHAWATPTATPTPAQTSAHNTTIWHTARQPRPDGQDVQSRLSPSAHPFSPDLPLQNFHFDLSLPLTNCYGQAGGRPPACPNPAYAVPAPIK